MQINRVSYHLRSGCHLEKNYETIEIFLGLNTLYSSFLSFIRKQQPVDIFVTTDDNHFSIFPLISNDSNHDNDQNNIWRASSTEEKQ